MKTYKGKINKLEPHQIFVFGSNPQGRHGKGAALIAKQLFGAKVGQTVSFRSTDGYFLMVKTAETPFKAVSYAEAKDRVRLEMAFKYANDEIEKIK